ncbi:MAG: hypothetical protein M1830_009179 [Pleopsidium flavum]|nr:MAG: hypothetical protein M1830_009179 [Pleopsidium flavum]
MRSTFDFLQWKQVQQASGPCHSLSAAILVHGSEVSGILAYLLDEEERLGIQHNVLNKTFDGRLVFPPLVRLKKVLDCGYGSASWAAEIAEQFPDSEVIGVDISPHMKQDDTPENFWPQASRPYPPFASLRAPGQAQQTRRVAPKSSYFPRGTMPINRTLVEEWREVLRVTRAKLAIADPGHGLGNDAPYSSDSVQEIDHCTRLYLLDDLNQSFTFRPNTFDLVHSRLVASGINKSRWPTYLRDIVRALKPGGWLQMVELYYNCQSYNGSITDGHALRQWSTKYLQSLEDVKDLRAPMRLQGMMGAAGLVNLEHRMIELPLCGWSNNPREREIGELNRENIRRLLESLALYPFTQRLGMTLVDFQALISRARTEAVDRSLKAYFPL